MPSPAEVALAASVDRLAQALEGGREGAATTGSPAEALDPSRERQLYRATRNLAAVCESLELAREQLRGTGSESSSTELVLTPSVAVRIAQHSVSPAGGPTSHWAAPATHPPTQSLSQPLTPSMLACVQAFGGKPYKRFTAVGMQNLDHIFRSCDMDASGVLSMSEMNRILGLLNITKARAQIQQCLMEANVNGTDDNQEDVLDFNEFTEGLNQALDDHFEGHVVLDQEDLSQLQRLQTVSMKVGFGGTTWRRMANTTWLATQVHAGTCRHMPRAVVLLWRQQCAWLSLAWPGTVLQCGGSVA
eukprot:COSAG01_NODE_12088_length_1803_cov_0.985915_2_plen_303_part_00